MSYDLNFWKYKQNIYLNNQAVYEQCSDEQIVDGLENLPIDNIVADIANAFSNWNRVSSDAWEGKGAFQIFTTPQFVRINCYGMESEDMNKFIDVMLEYGCPLYDPQVPQRFDGNE
jgi:hypothetical protein